MSAMRLLVLLSLSIFCGEFAIMVALDYVRIESEFITNLVDSTALVVIVFPSLYFFALKTIMRQNRSLTAAHRRLVASKRELEKMVDERTCEITVANRELRASIEQLNARRSETTRLSEMVNFFQACRDLKEAFLRSEPQWQALFPALSGSLFLMKASHNILENVVSWGTPSSHGACHAPEECWAVRRGKPHVSGGPDGMVPCKHLAAGSDRRFVCLPLAAHGEMLGTLCLEAANSAEASVARYDADTAAYHSAVAESLALALSNLRLRETLRHQAIRDQLTGLYNRRYLLETFERELARAAAHGQPLTLAMLDIDHFKQFNDSFGHAAGDAVLARIGMLLRDWKRSEDIVGRYGGEELCIVLPDTPAQEGLTRIDELRQAIGALTIDHHGQTLPPVTISAGLASYPRHALERDELVDLADEALYRSKREGRNCVCLAAEGTREIAAA